MCFIFSCWPLFAMGQVNTGFESGLGVEWEQFPENCWESSPDQALSGLYSLHHSFDNTVSGTDRISFETGNFDTNRNISWEFSLRHGYTPSSSNKWQVYLAADKGAIELGASGSVSGYVLGVNVTGSDDSLRIYSIQKGKLSILGTASVNYENDIGFNSFHCLVKRDSNFLWQVFAAVEGTELNLIGSFQEAGIVLPVLSHFMISYSYTSAKDRLLWFDDLLIQAEFLVDTIPPKIMEFKIPGRNEIFLGFSEEIDITDLHKENFLLIPGNVFPERVNAAGENISCYFNENFTQRTDYKLIASDIKDIEGNLMSLDSIQFFYYRAEKDDLVITEIMADPTPPVYLSESEYVELYNRCEFPLDLDSFILQTGKREWVFPQYVIDAGEYLLVTKGSRVESNSLPLFSSSSVITNEGQQIFLKNKYGEIITATEFYSDWYADDFKSDGGWSLERIDASNLCGGKENWKASEDETGGTPGRQNSVQAINEDHTAPIIERLEFVSDNKIRLIFSENLDPHSFPPRRFFDLVQDSMFADSVNIPDNFCHYAEIVFKEKFQKGAEYQLVVPVGITDCAGNQLEIQEAIRFGLPAASTLTDIIMTEVMFTSFPGCPEYIELYNQSENLLDLSDLRISVNKTGEFEKPSIPIKTPVLFFPGEYLVLCRSKQNLQACHEIENMGAIIEASELPSLPDDGACIRFMNRSLESIDVFCYMPEDEFKMLSDIHGVSLERLILDRKTGDQSFWHSASSLAGFGTPGKENSQSLSGISSQRKIEIMPEIFSPDNDGKDDILEIHYSIEKEGFVGTIAVFDPSGRIVCYLGENEILGTSGMFLWDGRDGTGKICNTGLYLIYAEFWNLKGEKERFKKAVVLVRQ